MTEQTAQQHLSVLGETGAQFLKRFVAINTRVDCLNFLIQFSLVDGGNFISKVAVCSDKSKS